MSKPKVIIEVRGGMIQSVYANTDIEFVNLDWDIFDDFVDQDDDRYLYDGRHYGSSVTIAKGKKWNKIEEELKKSWNEEYKKSSREDEA